MASGGEEEGRLAEAGSKPRASVGVPGLEKGSGAERVGKSQSHSLPDLNTSL